MVCPATVFIDGLVPHPACAASLRMRSRTTSLELILLPQSQISLVVDLFEPFNLVASIPLCYSQLGSTITLLSLTSP